MKLTIAVISACLSMGALSVSALEYQHKAFVKGLFFSTVTPPGDTSGNNGGGSTGQIYPNIVITTAAGFPSTTPSTPSYLDVSVLNGGDTNALINLRGYLDSGLFTFEQTTCGTQGSPVSLAAGATCVARVKFTPPGEGSYFGTLAFNADNSNNGVQSKPLQVEVIGSENIQVQSASNLEFTLVQGDSTTRTLSYINTGDGHSSNTYFDLTTSASNVFSVTSNTCGTLASPVSLQSGQGCSAVVLASSLNLGTFMADGVLHSGASSILSNTITAHVVEPLTGTWANYSQAAGLGPGSEAIISSSFDFGSVEAGGGAITKYFLVNPNNGIGYMSLAFDSSNSSEFTVSSVIPVYYPIGGGTYGSSACDASSVAPYCLAVNTRPQLLVGVTFHPATNGAKSTTLTPSSNNNTITPAVLSMTGTGINPSINANSTDGAFGNVVYNGTNYSEKTYQFSSSSSSVALTGLQASITGSSSFSMVSNTCGTSASPVTLSGGTTCSVKVRFTPAAYSSVTGSLTVSASNASSSKVVSLNGTGAYNTALLLNFDTGFTGAIDSSPQAISIARVGTAASSSPGAISSNISTKSNFANSVEFSGAASGPTQSCSFTVGHALEATARNTLLDSLSTQSQFTIEAWVKPTATGLSGLRGILSDYETCGTYAGWVLALNAGKPYINLPNAGADKVVASPTALTAGTWNHIAVTKNGTTVYLYVNGTLMATGTSFTSPGASTNAATKLRVGNFQSLDGPFNGEIDAVRVISGSALASGSGSTFPVPTAQYQ